MTYGPLRPGKAGFMRTRGCQAPDEIGSGRIWASLHHGYVGVLCLFGCTSSLLCSSAVCVWTFHYLVVPLYDHARGVIFQYIRARSDHGQLTVLLRSLCARFPQDSLHGSQRINTKRPPLPLRFRTVVISCFLPQLQHGPPVTLAIFAVVDI